MKIRFRKDKTIDILAGILLAFIVICLLHALFRS